jgi:hypothetical protein
MKRALLAVGAAVIFAAPAIAADNVVIEKRTTTTTTTKEVTPDVPGSGSTVSTVVLAPNPPPEPRVEVRPPAPGPSVVWVGGNWRWSTPEKNFVWVPGKYVEPPRARAAWVPGRWMQRPDGWVFEDGRWD